eukprot:CAMPEP_0196573464 /NCGR_PEP_ID=MMETSP1081-20130531/3365_1 /TAXON_ID=36882 /ORGANISM="Pyramimonas amylifera, Strain CCMP720" /LENGTH=256 /DNA_ID=CAMNT_0041891185 /DNA_START=249 /DNA_END=1019 /DNA_ORIENTATION=+
MPGIAITKIWRTVIEDPPAWDLPKTEALLRHLDERIRHYLHISGEETVAVESIEKWIKEFQDQEIRDESEKWAEEREFRDGVFKRDRLNNGHLNEPTVSVTSTGKNVKVLRREKSESSLAFLKRMNGVNKAVKRVELPADLTHPYPVGDPQEAVLMTLAEFLPLNLDFGRVDFPVRQKRLPIKKKYDIKSNIAMKKKHPKRFLGNLEPNRKVPFYGNYGQGSQLRGRVSQFPPIICCAPYAHDLDKEISKKLKSSG